MFKIFCTRFSEYEDTNYGRDSSCNFLTIWVELLKILFLLQNTSCLYEFMGGADCVIWSNNFTHLVTYEMGSLHCPKANIPVCQSCKLPASTTYLTFQESPSGGGLSNTATPC
uniref:Macaca fascicularis brain cDNA, clone: QtrA-15269 n=1 Tax=Macaca fascicularis TaxID=9541 RepID=I7GJ86_MACFA|nr:unnamed protein product [Macaca fascicularis]